MSAFRDASPGVMADAASRPGLRFRHQEIVERISGIVSTVTTPLLVNLSCWASRDDLLAFTYSDPHRRYLSARARWFIPIDGPTTALWWQPAETTPTVELAIAKLVKLREHGTSEDAFPISAIFRPPPPETS